MFRMMIFWGTFLLAGNVFAQPSSFQQGPEQVGQTQTLAGKVIGAHQDLGRTCFIVLADQAKPGYEGMGGGGRFFLCQEDPTLSMGDTWQGKATQTGTRMLRVGPRMRVIPMYIETQTPN